MNQQTISLVITVAVLLPMLYFRFRKMMKPQRLKLKLLWIRPALMLGVAGAMLAAAPPGLMDMPWFVAAGLLGGFGGWYWGKFTHLDLHPEDGTVMSRGSQAGMLVLVLLLVFRIGMRAGIDMEAAALHMSAALLTDILIVFTVLLFAVRGLEIFLRARQLMRAKA